ncbi:conserved exported hypothetical protein [Bradyrhizobium sp. STM 3843]|uniref:hypothetical protein n=1 Tax=Bradyrhizobium sp. STM 3843 TaxID=551947 RepID=UPI00024042F0|nr:hypothetical protein [Bradyrhizobium sp. STM 3843]CCE07960.1 conserved exported hypothetical protein [Bradyrhizobium sp. STM 3843]
MRITVVIFVGSLAAIVAVAAPALAKNSQAPKIDDQQVSSSPCRAYQQAPDGTWTELPCQEPGASAPSRQKSVSSGAAAPSR